MRLHDLPSVLRAAGLDVVEMDGWKASGKDLFGIRGVVVHHTATGPKIKDDAVERLLRNGRPDLAGPLCQLGLRRDGTWVVIAAGKANHNGYGKWGNDSIGVEAYNDGVGEPWPQVQYDSYVAGCRALAKRFGVPVAGHKETDPGRKIDPTFDMDEFRRHIAADKEDDMPLTIEEIGAIATSSANAVMDRLNAEGTAFGLEGFGNTVKHSVELGRVNANSLAVLLSRDETITAADIAAAIPDGLAQAVADELAERLKD